MSTAMLKIMVDVFTLRMANGETFEQICASYPRLTEADIAQLKTALGIA